MEGAKMCSVMDQSRVMRGGGVTLGGKKGEAQRDGAKQGKRYVYKEAE